MTCWPRVFPVDCIVSRSSCARTGCVPDRTVVGCRRMPGSERQYWAISSTASSALNQKWVADFTYIWTAEGWLYVAAVVDLFSRRVVGWAMMAEMTAQFVTNAPIMAIWRRGKPDSLLHHSDQGSQYTSEQFQRLMADQAKQDRIAPQHPTTRCEGVVYSERQCRSSRSASKNGNWITRRWTTPTIEQKPRSATGRIAPPQQSSWHPA